MQGGRHRAGTRRPLDPHRPVPSPTWSSRPCRARHSGRGARLRPR